MTSATSRTDKKSSVNFSGTGKPPAWFQDHLVIGSSEFRVEVLQEACATENHFFLIRILVFDHGSG